MSNTFKKLSVYVSPALAEEVEELAELERRSVSQTAQLLIEEALKARRGQSHKANGESKKNE